MSPQRIVSVVGLGVIGGSIAYGLKRAGWTVVGVDVDRSAADDAYRLGYIDRADDCADLESDLVVVCVPPLAVVSEVVAALRLTDCPVTDVASVKSFITSAVSDPRFVPGHPMAGSEKVKLEGVSASLFEQAAWILTPTSETDEVALSVVASAVKDLRAEVRMMDAAKHDQLVAAISHAPHLVAVTLVNSVFKDGDDDTAILARVAGGGFRDLTRVASSEPGIWLDICRTNRTAIRSALVDVAERLQALARTIDQGDELVLTNVLGAQLLSARSSRDAIPPRPEKHAELVVELKDQALREVFRAATRLDVRIADWYEAAGKIHVSVPLSESQTLWGGLTAMGLNPVIER